MSRYSSESVRVPYPNCGSDTRIHMTWMIGQEVGDHVSPYSVDRWILLATLRNRRITAHSLQMRYLRRHGRRVSVQTIRNQLHASQLKSRKAGLKPLLTTGATIEFIDDQSCLWAVAHYCHREILANLCSTAPLFSGSYLSLWSWYWDTISGIWKGIDTHIKWYNQLIYENILNSKL